ncbi:MULTISPECIES: tubby C-terminal domain-like protein [Shouchella]|uniref:tubby C-terminal domain-like protein n=1 Tax=Shouchella TaxID=2893057 RepID=UPI000BA54672|nr:MULTISPECIES: hypothetical protein [Shouchella]MCM3380933.1 hypothetical protein [Shouchella rhizosphaerae]PAD17773.1 hypothetical protein CHH73_08370 [Shouchella clausii]PAE81543.1 hypothetical protein CHH77_13500 [Shouchella clausii]
MIQKQEPEFDYSFKLPYLRRSTKPIYVNDIDGKKIGIIQKYYSSNLDKFLDQYASLINKTNYRISMENVDQAFQAVFGKLKDTLFRNKWDIFKDEEIKVGSLINKTKIQTNPRYLYTTEHETYNIKSDLLDKNTFITDSSGTIIAKTYYKNVVAIRDVYIKIYRKNILTLEEILILAIVTVKVSD